VIVELTGAAPLLAKLLLGVVGRRLPALVLGPPVYRELSRIASSAIAETARSEVVQEPQRAYVESMLAEAFNLQVSPTISERWRPSDGSLTLRIFEVVHNQLRTLADNTVTGVGVSALEVLDIDADQLADVLSTRVIDNIELAGLSADSALRPIAQLLSDERHYNSLLRELKRLGDAQESSAARPRTFSATVNLFDQNVTVPDGTNAAELRLAITNPSDEHLRLRALVLNVAESRPSDVVRLRQAGAAVTEFDLQADLTKASSVELLGGHAVQWVLRPDETDAFVFMPPLLKDFNTRLSCMRRWKAFSPARSPRSAVARRGSTIPSNRSRRFDEAVEGHEGAVLVVRRRGAQVVMGRALVLDDASIATRAAYEYAATVTVSCPVCGEVVTVTQPLALVSSSLTRVILALPDRPTSHHELVELTIDLVESLPDRSRSEVLLYTTYSMFDLARRSPAHFLKIPVRESFRPHLDAEATMMEEIANDWLQLGRPLEGLRLVARVVGELPELLEDPWVSENLDLLLAMAESESTDDTIDRYVDFFRRVRATPSLPAWLEQVYWHHLRDDVKEIDGVPVTDIGRWPKHAGERERSVDRVASVYLFLMLSSSGLRLAMDPLPDWIVLRHQILHRYLERAWDNAGSHTRDRLGAIYLELSGRSLTDDAELEP
jgi:hypothetical protein